MKRPPLWAVIFGTGFGSGFWPWGPGTAGALLATLLWVGGTFVFTPQVLLAVTGALIVLFTMIGTVATNALEPYWGEDPKRVVIDEMIGVWIPLMVCPADRLWWALLAFVLFRFFDILKPLGIRWFDRQHGGFWVQADDIVAGLYSLILILLVQWAI